MMNPDIDSKVEMEVVPQLSNAKHARRGQKAISYSTVLYCIHYVGYEGYFTFSYLSEQDAKNVIRMMRSQGTDTVRYMQFNYVKDVDGTLHVHPKD